MNNSESQKRFTNALIIMINREKEVKHKQSQSGLARIKMQNRKTGQKAVTFARLTEMMQTTK